MYIGEVNSLADVTGHGGDYILHCVLIPLANMSSSCTMEIVFGGDYYNKFEFLRQEGTCTHPVYKKKKR